MQIFGVFENRALLLGFLQALDLAGIYFFKIHSSFLENTLVLRNLGLLVSISPEWEVSSKLDVYVYKHNI